jgi:hypothetical protein
MVPASGHISSNLNDMAKGVGTLTYDGQKMGEGNKDLCGRGDGDDKAGNRGAGQVHTAALSQQDHSFPARPDHMVNLQFVACHFQFERHNYSWCLSYIHVTTRLVPLVKNDTT